MYLVTLSNAEKAQIITNTFRVSEDKDAYIARKIKEGYELLGVSFVINRGSPCERVVNDEFFWQNGLT